MRGAYFQVPDMPYEGAGLGPTQLNAPETREAMDTPHEQFAMATQLQPVSRSSRVYDNYQNLLVKQTKRGCFQEWFGCEAVAEFEVLDATAGRGEAHANKTVMMAEETSSCLLRLVLGGYHPWTIAVRGQDPATGGVLATNAPAVKHDRPLRLPMMPCKCCCFQEVQHMEATDGRPLGTTVEQCYVCVPRFHVKKSDGDVEYVLSQPTCCGGAVVDLCAEGFCNCRVPFYVYDPKSTVYEKDNMLGKIVKVWSGLFKEAFTEADTFEVTFPPGAASASKARLMGSLFLINQLGYEGGN